MSFLRTLFKSPLNEEDIFSPDEKKYLQLKHVLETETFGEMEKCDILNALATLALKITEYANLNQKKLKINYMKDIQFFMERVANECVNSIIEDPFDIATTPIVKSVSLQYQDLIHWLNTYWINIIRGELENVKNYWTLLLASGTNKQAIPTTEFTTNLKKYIDTMNDLLEMIEIDDEEIVRYITTVLEYYSNYTTIQFWKKKVEYYIDTIQFDQAKLCISAIQIMHTIHPDVLIKQEQMMSTIWDAAKKETDELLAAETRQEPKGPYMTIHERNKQKETERRNKLFN